MERGGLPWMKVTVAPMGMGQYKQLLFKERMFIYARLICTGQVNITEEIVYCIKADSGEVANAAEDNRSRFISKNTEDRVPSVTGQVDEDIQVVCGYQLCGSVVREIGNIPPAVDTGLQLFAVAVLDSTVVGVYLKFSPICTGEHEPGKIKDHMLMEVRGNVANSDFLRLLGGKTGSYISPVP